MKRRPALALLLIAIFVAVSAACGSSSTPSDSSAPKFAFGLSAQVIASGADAAFVRAIEFAPDGRMFYAEQFSDTPGSTPGTSAADIRVVLADGTLQPTPFATLQVANYLNLDWGLTGLALDPQFATSHFVYAFYTAPVGDNIGKPSIVRFTDNNGTGQDQRVISSDFPQTYPNHQGYNANGDLHFGPDGYLYASVGDYDQGSAKPAEGGHPELINLSSPVGKLLRVNKADGSAAPGNPFAAQAGADPRVFASGFREPFSFTFDPVSGSVYGTDNTTVSCEELNVITAGKSYGWGTMGDFPFANCAAGSGQQPIYNYSREGAAPGDFLSFVETQGVSFLKSSTYSQLTDGLVVCESQKSVVNEKPSPGALVRFVLSSPSTVASSDIIVPDCKGDAYAHNGVVYYSDATQLLKLTQSGQSGTNQQPPSAGG
jgi:glucose/arabinose dehydrogenase